MADPLGLTRLRQQQAQQQQQNLARNDPMMQRYSQLQTSAAARASEPRSGASSGFLGEKDYINALNEEGELADIQSIISGKGGVKRQGFYPASTGVPGLRQTRPGVGELSMAGEGGADDYQNYDPIGKMQRESSSIMRQANEDSMMDTARQAGQFNLDAARQRENEDAVARAQDRGPSFELASGRAGARAQQVGDIMRGQGLQDARAAARTYMDPVVGQGREQQLSDEERLLDARYGKADELEQKRQAAIEAANAKRDVAWITQQGGMTREGMRGLLKSRELRGLLTGKTDPSDSQLDTLMNTYAHGQSPEETQAPAVDDASLAALIAGAGTSNAGKQQLKALWGQLTPEQQDQARKALARPMAR